MAESGGESYIVWSALGGCLDTRTGEIKPLAAFQESMTPAEIEQWVIPIAIDHLSCEAQNLLAHTGVVRISRNSKCPCGSGKRFKRCHMRRP